MTPNLSFEEDNIFNGEDGTFFIGNHLSHWQIGKWWNIAIKYIIPLALVTLLLTQFIQDIKTPYEGYPTWALGIGWTIALLPLLIFLWLLLKDKNKIISIEDQ